MWIYAFAKTFKFIKTRKSTCLRWYADYAKKGCHMTASFILVLIDVAENL